MMVAYYQHDISGWMDGTEGLEDGEYRAYHVICELLYLNNGPIILHESGIAGRCNQHPLAFRRNVEKLVQRKKLIRTDDGKISNRRVESELARIMSKRRKTAVDPARTPAQPPGGSLGVQRGSRGGNGSKPLENKEPALFDDTLDKTRQDSLSPNGERRDPDVRTDLFRYGLSVLIKITGKTPSQCRALIGAWLKETRDDAVAVLRIIEDAKRENVADPVPWIKRALVHRYGATGARPSRNGRAALALRMMQQNNEEET